MSEGQRAKYAQVLEKLDPEQQEEFIHMVRIINQSMPEKRITIKGQTYYTFIWADPIAEKMRIIVSCKGYTINPVDKPIKESRIPEEIGRAHV